MSASDILELRAAFKAMDTNQDGNLSLYEIQSGLDKIGNATMKQRFAGIIDLVHGEGSISYEDFLASTLDKRALQEEEV